MELLALVCAVAVGYAMGIFQKGIHINHTSNVVHTEPIPEPQAEPNETSKDLLPEEYRNYAERNNGYINF